MSIARSDERRAQIVPAVVAVFVYLAAVRNGFAYDDVVIIVQNERIHHWATLLSGLGVPYWFNTGHLYRPLTTLAFGLEWILSNGSPVVFHAVNILWHAVVSALVSRLALRWWSPSAALCAGLVFAILPVHVEAVANVVGRSELVCAAALIAVGLVASARPERDGGLSEAPGRNTDSAQLLLVGVLTAVALASKETGATAPVIAWAAAWTRVTPGPESQEGRRRRAWRLAAASAAAVCGMIGVRYAVLGSLAGDDPHPAFVVTQASFGGLWLALASLPRAVSLMLMPQLPRPDYSPTDAVLAHPNFVLVACGVALVAIGLAIVALHLVRPTPWTFAGVFTVVTLAPVSNLILHTGVVVAERTLYSPSIGVALIVGAGVVTLWKAVPGSSAAGSVGVVMVRTAMIAGAGVFAFFALAFSQASIPIWRDSATAFAAIRERAPTSYRGYYLEADAERGRREVAAAHHDYGLAIDRFSGDIALLHHAGLNALAAHDTAAALRWLSRALAIDSTQLTPRTDLAQLYLHRGDTLDARKLLQDGVRIEPDQRTWRQLLASITTGGGDPR